VVGITGHSRTTNGDADAGRAAPERRVLDRRRTTQKSAQNKIVMIMRTHRRCQFESVPAWSGCEAAASDLVNGVLFKVRFHLFHRRRALAG